MMTQRIGEQNFQNSALFINNANEKHNERSEVNILKSKEINQLAAKFENSGIFTAEASKILAQNILNGSVDVYV
ncbi:MAG: hypothetical protein JXK07_00500 [Spirochaetes bacterium]|nr:hypothetical protein [Spirochaetota bacterium]MBN2769505.1 hypothetical protein [Spirochaetota bacterium]HRX16086.1 hypothetical protein [Spirochaetota bacterium]